MIIRDDLLQAKLLLNCELESLGKAKGFVGGIVRGINRQLPQSAVSYLNIKGNNGLLLFLYFFI